MIKTANSVRTMSAICIGNAMEWYDFMIFNYLLLFIAQAYFPSQNDIHSLLATMISSGVALVVRPIGGILLGAWADKRGHHKALMLVFYLMTVATALITLTPTYAKIGIIATVLLVGARLLQGLATGGEFGIASSLLAALAPMNKKGLYTSLQMVGQLLALILGSSLCFLLTMTCSEEVLYQYAWRLPFAFGLVILPIAWVLRRQLQNQGFWRSMKPKSVALLPLIRRQKGTLVIGLGLVIGCTGSVYTLFSYMPVFGKKYLHFTLWQAYLGPLVGTTISALLIPAFGALSDKIGKKQILVISLTVYLSLIFPLLSMLNSNPSTEILVLVESILALCIAAYFGVFTSVLSNLFPEEGRSTCLAISYNLGVMLFGGFAPFVITALIEYTKNPMIFTYYLMLAVSISLFASLFYKEGKQVAKEPQLVDVLAV
ncbi:MFS transporter [Legionella waltersii]|uniref:MFS transporter n=1 Tax=Legionella waltersii TaxID=66969 RepID=A0A0W1ABV0_9GAMM|nr:MFS transporter [Legionella waltersii]KTD78793.1 MFS transporter [Legionella waltersii]SNV11116.1 MFS transporter [Legionella waltersii]